jgi:multicomponent Na+:H+ antiporter subunit D
MGTLEAGQIGLLAVLMVSSLLSLVYLLEVPVRAFFSAPPEDVSRPEGIHEAPWPSVVALVITALATVALFIRPGTFYDLMTQVVAR